MDYLVAILQLLVLANLVCATTKLGSGTPLSDYIRHYEPVYYDHDRLHLDHHRAKRSPDTHLHLSFEAHGRTFNLRMRRDLGVFHPNLVVETSQGEMYYDTSRAYIGQLTDDRDSRIHGVITSTGVFEGSIETSGEKYRVERSFHHFPSPQAFHSVIYRHSDIHMPHLNASLCTADRLHHKIRQMQPALNKQDKYNRELLKQRTEHTNTTYTWINSDDHHSLDFSKHKLAFGDGEQLVKDGQAGHRSEQHLHRRHKRAIDPSKTTCTLFVQADHLFYRKFHKNTETVIEQLTQHVQGVNDIYSAIDFDGDSLPDSINFIIKRIKVHTDSSASGYKFPGSYGVETFLELFSEDNFDAFCLAYMFTYRDFEGGTLGLAWTGDLQNAGGVCEKNGFRGSLKSLNSGIVTILNYGKDVPSTVSHVTMAHEIGHNMGSQHDPETSECSPGGEPGNYIMFARATSGDKPNNNKFSACSKASMATVMEAKARHSSGCFIAPTTSICGNEVVEAGEECDCGWEDECADQCCYPQTSNELIRERPCTRRPAASCSPSEGPCCTDYCQIIGPAMNKTCREPTACKSAAFCDGTGPACPFSRQKRDRSFCDDGYVCYQGECTGSICMAYELESCQCEPDDPSDFDHPDLCKLCCKQPGDGYPCLSSFVWNIRPYDVPDLMAKPGMPCNNYKGYCDVLHKCREVDPEGPLANLKKLLFSSEGLGAMKNWIVRNWYILLSAMLGFIILIVSLALFIKICSPKVRKKKAANQTPVLPIKPPTPVNTGNQIISAGIGNVQSFSTRTSQPATTAAAFAPLPPPPQQAWKNRSSWRTDPSPLGPPPPHQSPPSVHTDNYRISSPPLSTSYMHSSSGKPMYFNNTMPSQQAQPSLSSGGHNSNFPGRSMFPPGPNYQDYLIYASSQGNYPNYSFYPTTRKPHDGWV